MGMKPEKVLQENLLGGLKTRIEDVPIDSSANDLNPRSEVVTFQTESIGKKSFRRELRNGNYN
jgi:hypothetical protein